MKAHARRQVIVLGGGFAGLAAALELARQRDFRRLYNVTLVDKNCYHLYHALLYEVATAHYDIRPQDVEYLQGGACIRLKALGELATKRQVDVVQASASGIYAERQSIACAGQPDLPYDHLLIAVGSEPTDFGIPGVREHAIMFRDIPDALAIRERVRAFISSDRGTTVRPRRVLIAGGGFTGVELAGELLEYLRKLERQRQIELKSITVTVVEAGDALVKPLGPTVSAQAQRRLERLGAEFSFMAPITQVAPASVRLKDGRAIPYDLLIWSGGVQANRLIAASGLPTVGRGQLAVESTLRVRGCENVWGAGDGMAFVDPATSQPIPQVAPLAVDAGRLAAANIARSIHGEPLRTFHPRHAGFVVPVGGKYAIARLRLIHARGFLAWLLRKAIDLNYFMSIMSFRNALKVFVRGGRVYLKND